MPLVQDCISAKKGVNWPFIIEWHPC